MAPVDVARLTLSLSMAQDGRGIAGHSRDAFACGCRVHGQWVDGWQGCSKGPDECGSRKGVGECLETVCSVGSS